MEKTEIDKIYFDMYNNVSSITYFDIEYSNPQNRSICQIGLINEKYVDGKLQTITHSFLVNPEDNFDKNCILVHGITPEAVKYAPNFPTVWKSIEAYFTNAIVVGHCVASADLNALVKNLIRYSINVPELYYVCTHKLSKQLIPSFSVKNYKLSSLCERYNIELENAHNAIDDTKACKNLLYAIIEEFGIDITKYVTKYENHSKCEFTAHSEKIDCRKSIVEFYGMVRSFSFDNKISDDEVAFIKNWKNQNNEHVSDPVICDIISIANEILEDDTITIEESRKLLKTMIEYLETLNSTPVTLATQILDGILRGITVDGTISEAECEALRLWLYDNIYLSNHYPFNKIMVLIENVLKDSIITNDEASLILRTIDEMLNPIQELTCYVNSFDGKHVCLSGDFEYGSKSDVEKYIISQGGNIDSNVKKSTDYLIVGNKGSSDYAYGSYGTKVKKALEYNEKGCKIQIVKETEIIKKS